MDSSREQKPRRRWLRFRFGLRGLLLFTSLVAVLLSIEAWRTRDQREFAAKLDALGGSYDRGPRKWIPQFARRLLDQEESGPIVSFDFEVMQVPASFNWKPYRR